MTQSRDETIDRVLQLDEEMRDMPGEVRDVIQPTKLSQHDSFQFRCYPGISCFNSCCKNIEIILTPYDILRLRRRLDLTAEEFLYAYADPTVLQRGEIPVAVMRMDSEGGGCPFNTPEGCSVYSDRPVNCRYYPIGMALLHRQQGGSDEQFYLLIKEPFCQGHHEQKRWTIAEWRQDQGSDGYDQHNRGWMELILKRRTAGDMAKTSTQLAEFCYMASTNPDEFRRFVFDSTFLKRYQVDPELEQCIRDDDVALTEFAFAWLKSVLFGDTFVLPKPEAIAELKQRGVRLRQAESIDE
ncbi:MAG: YkgJ family cysteine cluster protein [Magnetococcales bacterium]|nr:YkgJ family cysteine cluster protein [Magnetococcales bacterium]